MFQKVLERTAAPRYWEARYGGGGADVDFDCIAVHLTGARGAVDNGVGIKDTSE